MRGKSVICSFFIFGMQGYVAVIVTFFLISKK